MAIYVGVASATSVQPTRREVFRSNVEPSEHKYGARFAYVIGPFRTLRAAQIMATYGQHGRIASVAEAEVLAKTWNKDDEQ